MRVGWRHHWHYWHQAYYAALEREARSKKTLEKPPPPIDLLYVESGMCRRATTDDQPEHQPLPYSAPYTPSTST